MPAKKKFMFSLEALEARHGDSLLLHFGDPAAPRLILIDGGPRGVYNARLRKRLEALKKSRANSGALQIDIAMVSHLDDDHIAGISDLVTKMKDRADAGDAPLFEIVELWNNTFDDIVGKADPASMGQTAQVASMFDPGKVPATKRDAAAIVATVNQGRTLRNAAAALGLTVNAGKSAVAQGVASTIGSGDRALKLHVLWPDEGMLDDLHVEWDKKVKANNWVATPASAEIAAYVDDSVYNLASIVVLAELGGKRILLTGDALGSDILEGCRRSSAWKGKPPYKVDVLKVPHHGSDRNVETSFFRDVPAKHYVISGDGGHGNPEMATLQMIVDARGDADYTVHITNRKGKKDLARKLTNKLKTFPKKIRDKFVFRDVDAESLVVDLGASLGD